MADKKKKTGLPKKVVAATLSIQLMASAAIPLWAAPVDQFSTPAASAAITQEKEAITFEQNGITYKTTSEDTVQVGDGVNTMTNVKGKITIPQTVQYNGKTYNVTSIGEKAFMRVESLTGATLPEGINTISKYAFFGSGIKEMKMPNTVTTLGPSSFRMCQSLGKLELSNKLASIPENAFEDTAIKTITVPEGVKTIETYAFNSCKQLEEVNLPASLETIGSSSFWSNEALREVHIAEQSKLTKIAEKAFEFSEKLKSINLPAGLKIIEANAFANCTGLSSIGLGEDSQLESLGERALASTAIKTFYIPESLKTFDKRPLGGCTELHTISVAENNTLFKSDNGVLFSKDGKTLLQYPAKKSGSTYNIPKTVNNIEDYAFQNVVGLDSLDIPNNVTNIGQNAFANSTINEIKIPESVKTIGTGAFYKTNNIQEVVLPNSLSVLPKSLFSNCENLTKVTFGANIKELPNSNFYNCENLNEIVIRSDKLKTIPKGAFNGASESVKITVPTDEVKTAVVNSGISKENVVVDPTLKPEDITFVEGGITYKTNGFDTVQVGDGAKAMTDVSGKVNIPKTVQHNGKTYTVNTIGKNAFIRVNAVTAIDLPDSITTIEGNAFFGTGITSFTMPDSVTELGNGAFRLCASLKNITLSSNLSKIPENAFESTGLKEITIPEGVASIDTYAFNSCSNLTTVNIPASVKTIGDSAFWGDSMISKVNIADPSQLTTIEKNAFNGVVALTAISLPASLKTIGDNAFSDCSKLATVSFGAGSKLEKLGTQAFSSTGIKAFHMPASLNTVGEYPLKNCKSLATITVDAGNKHFKDIDGVLLSKDGKTLIQYPVKKEVTDYTVPAGVTTIGEYAFSDVTGITKLIIPNHVMSIGSNAFYKSTISTMDIADSVNKIDSKAFYYCNNLEEVTLPNGLEKIERYLFSNCQKLRSVTIGANVKEISDSAFYSCRNLDTITILSDKAKTIGKNAFSGAAEAVKISVPTQGVKDAVVNSGIAAENVIIKEAPKPVVETFVLDGVTYKVTGEDTVQVGDGVNTMTNVKGKITIPQTVENSGKTYKITSIGEKAFMRVEGLTGATLPEGITTISKYAFFGSGIKEMKMPNTVTTLGPSSFRMCQSLGKLELSNKLTTIPENAFEDTAIKTLTVPEGVETIETYAFNACKQLEEVNLPASLETIGSSSFWSNEALREVHIADQSKLTKIEEKAFAFSEKLKSINLPASIETIETDAFANCTVLADIGFAEDSQLKVLGDSALSSTALKTFYMPASLTTVGERPLKGCKELTAITVAKDNKLFKDEDGILYSKDGSELIQYPSKKQMKEFTVPANVKTIGKQAFHYAKDLNTLNIPATVDRIENNAFEGAGISQFNISDEVSSIGKLAFYHLDNVTEIKLPNSLTTLEDTTISGCKNLEKVTFGSNLTKLPNRLISSCPSLETIIILSDKLDTIPSGTFSNAPDTVKITVPSESMKTLVVKSGVDAQNVIVKEAVKPAASEFVVDDVLYKVLTQPTENKNGTVAIGNAKAGIAAVGEVTIPGTVTNDKRTYDVVKVSTYALKDSKITELHLPNTVKVIDDAAFKDAPELLNFEIPSGVETIGSNAIADCQKLTTITYAPNSSLTTLGNGALCGNTVLETIELPNTLKNIGTHTMYWNSLLREVTFQPGSTWTELPKGTFMRDYKLEAVNNLPTGLNVIGDEAFHNCENLKAFDLSKIISIGEGAFTNCNKLKEVVINDQVPALESGTFKDCTSLETVKLGEGITRFGAMRAEGEDEPSGVFENCTSLTEIVVPSKVTSLGRSTFQGCTNLAKIELKSKVIDEIGGSVFYEIPSDAQFYVENEAVKAFLVSDAFIEADNIHIIGGETPEPTPGEGGDEGGTTPTPGGGSVTPVPPVVPETPDTDIKPETEVKPDGSKVEIQTQEDGTTIETTTKPNGDVTEVVSKPDGSATITETRKDGTKVETQTTAQGNTTAAIAVPTGQKNVVVTIPKEDIKPNQVAVITKADGTKEVIKKSVASEDGLKLMVDENVKVEIVDNSKTFNDTDNHWANDAIDFVTSREIFNGMGEETFAPEAAMTRGMLVQVLYNFENQPEGSKAVDFGDVSSDAWFADAVAWAADNEIVAGVGEGNFAPNDNISREQLVTILYRYVGEPKQVGSLDKYSDASNVSDYAQNAMLWAVENGIVSGMGNNTLAPQGQATRAQVAQIMMNFCNLIVK